VERLVFKKSRVFALLVLLLVAVPYIAFAQDAAVTETEPAAETEPGTENETEPNEEAAEGEEAAVSEERQNEIDMLEMELKISNLEELAEWCRDLGLSEAGTRDALIARLRTALELPRPEPEEEGAQVIVIESARTTEYFSIEEVDEDYARLSGGVVVTLKDKTATHKISAWEMLYNRTRNILTATGGVDYLKEDGDTRETFRGESITINLDTWAGMFIDSVSEKSVAGGDTAYRFTGAVISQNGEEVSVLRDAKITNAKTDEPYWSLTASRLWLLPGTDWALLSGVLKVGEIPVLWVPAFFWPSDEFLFHPVVGTRTREGAFFQTTTYIWGKAKADPEKESSISKIMGSGADMEKERQGLFLRTTGRKSLGSDAKRWSVSVDGYANLGFYLGTDLALPAKDHFGATNFTFGLGISRNVYPVGAGFNPYIGTDGNVLDRDWNSSRLPFLPTDLPFRYRFKIDGSFSLSFASFKWDLPLYSDPNIDRDFYLNRSETFDWFTLLKNDTEEEELSTTTLGSYVWTVSANSTVPVKKVTPYISSLSLSNFATTLEFAAKQTSESVVTEMLKEDPKARDHLLYPGYYFYYPNKWTVYSLNGSVAGTPLTLGNRAAAPAEEESVVLNEFGLPRSPWAVAEEESAAASASSSIDLSPPSLSQTFSSGKDNGLRFTMDYRLTPSSATEMNFRTGAFDRRENIDFADIQKTQTRVRTDGSTTFTLAEPNNGFFSTAFSVTGYAEWQKSKLIPVDEDNPTAAEKTAEETENTNNYKATQFSSVYRFNTSIKPLYWNDIFGASTVTHTLEGKFLRWEFDPESYKPAQNIDDPTWDFIKGEWTREDITAHSMGTSLNASVFDKTQTLSLSAALPPLFKNYTYSLTLRAWISETSVSGSYREIVRPGQDSALKDPETDMKIQPHTFTETLTFGTGKTLRQSVVYDPDPEHEYFTSAVTTLTLGALNAQYTASRVTLWRYTTTGWTQPDSTDQDFIPVSFSLGYNPTIKQDSVFKNMLSYNIGLTSSLFLDLQRYNFSRFTLGLTAKATVTRFLDFSLTFLSENASIYRYMQDIPGFQIEGAPRVGGEANLFKDLADSFNLFDMEKRRGSGFKMKSMNLSLVHHLGDWDATLDVKMTPYLDDTVTTNRQYRFNTEVAFIVRWIPISEIKTEITYNEKTDRFTQK
jgi:lipopolysaccharide assembly outer membrane protein LptD (OstA)